MAELLHFPKLLEAAETDGEPPLQGVLPFLTSAHPHSAEVDGGGVSDRPENTLQLADEQARRAALDIRRSWIVEAPAGSGKTGLLIQRLLKLLAFGDLERPTEVLAITFTRKAAGELRNRVLEQLAAAAASQPLTEAAGEYERETRELAGRVLARDRAFGWNLLGSPQNLRISTIDAFCAELAGSRPLLSAGAGRYRPVDDASELYELAAERTVRRLGATDQQLHQALRCVLLHRDGDVGDSVGLIAGMLGEREQWGELVPLTAAQLTDEILDGEVRPRLEASLSRVVRSGLAYATEVLGPELLGELTRFASSLALEPGYKTVSPLRVCSGRVDPPGSLPDDIDHWMALLHLVLTGSGEWRRRLSRGDLKMEIAQPAKDRLGLLLEDLQASDERGGGALRKALCQVRGLPPARYPDDQWHVVKALFHVLRHALVELNVLFAERGECDFTEIALTARELLGSEPDMLSVTGAQLSHLLVDEMQDTSAGQYELLELLSRSWDGATQTVFLVGDPKQSIYLFRQARVARFLRTQTTGLLGDLPLGALRLTANFRSQTHLVDDFNSMFERVLDPGGAGPGALDELEIPFVAATSTRPGTLHPALQWHARLDVGEDGAVQADAAEHDAGDIRALVEDFCGRCVDRSAAGGKPGVAPRVAVLARSRPHLAPILVEFRKDRGSGPLPFRAVDVERLDDRQEILDLLALTRALLHPGDRTAWMAVLHSPVCGLQVGDLLALAGEGEDAQPSATVAHLVTTRLPFLSSDGQRTLRRAWPVLRYAREALGRTGFASLVERTWRSLGADAFLGPEQRTNARRYFQLLRKLESAPRLLTVPRIMRGLARLYAEPIAGDVAVELMTIHKAKGLEWDLVVVPALHRKTGDNRHELLKWLELDGAPGEEAEILLSPIAGKGEASSRLSTWLGKAQTSREEAETKRLLYVACTRAREELHLFAACERRNDGSLCEPAAGTLLRAAWPAAKAVLEEHLRIPGALSVGQELEPMSSTRMAPLSMAAAAEPDPPAGHEGPGQPAVKSPQPLYRLPEGFDPLQRFQPAGGRPLHYPAADTLRHRATFDRPEGSFAARAFGNVVHRFLDLLADLIAGGLTVSDLQKQIISWHPRVLASFRAEGLPTSTCLRETERTLQALDQTLRHPEGAWILSPNFQARSEYSLHVEAGGVGEAEGVGEAGGGVFRADRTFRGGAILTADGRSTHLWIVDFKTGDPGGRSVENFLASERQKYEAQMQAYARAMLRGERSAQPVILGLFYPLIPHLLYWSYDTENASDELNAGYP